MDSRPVAKIDRGAETLTRGESETPVSVNKELCYQGGFALFHAASSRSIELATSRNHQPGRAFPTAFLTSMHAHAHVLSYPLLFY